MSLTKISYSMIAGEAVSILDYGADPTGATSSTAALNAALASGNNVFIPKGTFKLTGRSIVPGGVRVFGLGWGKSKFLCDTQAHTGVFLQIAGGNNIVEDVSFEGTLITAGTAIRLSSENEYEFTGWITVRNVQVYYMNLGIDVNSTFAVTFENCRVFANTRGVRIQPSYDGVGDNGYFTTITFNKCYMHQNDDYGLYVNPTLVSKNLMLRDSVIEANTGSTSGYQSYIANCSPFTIENGYFEAVSTIPFMRLFSCTTYIYGAYVNGTGGLDLQGASNYVVGFNFYGTAANDKVISTGTSIQHVEFWDSSLGSNTSINAIYQLYKRTYIGATFYQNRVFGLGLQIADDSGVTNSSLMKEVLLYKKTVSATVPANGIATLISDQYLPNTWNSDFAMGHAQIVGSYQPNLICQVTTATTGSAQYYCVFVRNLSASPITLTNDLLKIMFIKGSAMSV